MKKKLQGSISVFLACLLLFVVAVVFSLLEVSRVWALEQRVKIDAKMTADSLLSNYNTKLWKDYGLLLIVGGQGSDQLQLSALEKEGLLLSTENMDLYAGSRGAVTPVTWNLSGIHPAGVEIQGYGLITDQEGAIFIQEAARIMESRFTEDVLQELYENITKEYKTEEKEVEVNETTKEITLKENPMDTVTGMKKKGVLSMITGTADLSDKELDLADTLQKRKLQKGTIAYEDPKRGWREKLLFRLYLETYFPNCRTCSGSHGLDYEMEYLIVGKASDKENLQGVLNRLLAVRELANLQYLKSNVEKQELILAAATAIGIATKTPELIEAYKAGITASWAYAESLSDVRLLLDGQRVSPIKTTEQWHTDLSGLADSLSNKEIRQTKGCDYEEYLQIFLWATKDSVLTYRAMDLIEANTGVNMNCHIYRMNGRILYKGKPLFSSLLSIGQGRLKEYQFEQAFVAEYLE